MNADPAIKSSVMVLALSAHGKPKPFFMEACNTQRSRSQLRDESGNSRTVRNAVIHPLIAHLAT